MRVELTESDLWARIGRLMVVNEILSARVRELEEREEAEDDVRATED